MPGDFIPRRGRKPFTSGKYSIYTINRTTLFFVSEEEVRTQVWHGRLALPDPRARTWFFEAFMSVRCDAVHSPGRKVRILPEERIGAYSDDSEEDAYNEISCQGRSEEFCHYSVIPYAARLTSTMHFLATR